MAWFYPTRVPVAVGRGSSDPSGSTSPRGGCLLLRRPLVRFWVMNEKSHTSDSRIEDPVRAEEHLRLSSLAMHLLDDAEIVE